MSDPGTTGPQTDPFSTPRKGPKVGSPDDLQRWQEDVKKRAAELQARGAKLRERMAEAEYTATSRDRFATVVVGSGGALRRVTINERARNASPATLSASIMSAYREATNQATRDNLDSIEELAGKDVAEKYRSVLPQFEEDPEENQ